MRSASGLAAAALVVVALGTTVPAGATAAARQISPKVTVDGKALPDVDADIGTADDPAVGRPAPTITGQGFDGQEVTFASGEPRILIFLSHSCPHCQAEVPRIVKLAKRGKLDGVEIQTVTTNTSEDLPNYPPSKWLKREKWPFSPVLADDARLRAFFAFGGKSFPYFVFVDAAGNVAARASGEIDPADLAEAARRLAAGESLVG
jgi:cytochrome c biogenesis protein CcmG, thiol:disulfide interchange protein DsbE